MSRDKLKRVGLMVCSTEAMEYSSPARRKTPLSPMNFDEHHPIYSVPYAPLRAVWMASELTRLFSGTHFIFSSPKPRHKIFEDIAERIAYKELVKDISPPMDVQQPFSSYKDQLGFGLHVVVTMFTGYLVGYAAFRALFNHSPAMNAAGGILGLVGAMFVETFLFIIRTSSADVNRTRKSSQKAGSSFSTSTIKKKQ